MEYIPSNIEKQMARVCRVENIVKSCQFCQELFEVNGYFILVFIVNPNNPK